VISLPVLVLNQNYDPLNICNVRRAIVLLDRGKAEMLSDGRGDLRTPTRTFPIPSVIRLEHMVRRPILQRRLSRREVFLRDSNLCQYCGKESRDLTLDHVIPRHRGGEHSWDNVVAACIPCNHRKAGHTLQGAGMRLLRAPRAPKPDPYALFHHRAILEEWRPFAPWLR
jgi:5-methylcytosine-specific restriction endonuclease McrA